MKDKYVIINLKNMDIMKDISGEIKFYDTIEDAHIDCGMYEFENVWIMKLIYNHIES